MHHESVTIVDLYGRLKESHKLIAEITTGFIREYKKNFLDISSHPLHFERKNSLQFSKFVAIPLFEYSKVLPVDKRNTTCLWYLRYYFGMLKKVMQRLVCYDEQNPEKVQLHNKYIIDTRCEGRREGQCCKRGLLVLLLQFRLLWNILWKENVICVSPGCSPP